MGYNRSGEQGSVNLSLLPTSELLLSASPRATNPQLEVPTGSLIHTSGHQNQEKMNDPHYIFREDSGLWALSDTYKIFHTSGCAPLLSGSARSLHLTYRTYIRCQLIIYIQMNAQNLLDGNPPTNTMRKICIKDNF